MKLLIVSSPTGGHFYPAIEVCKKLLPFCSQIVFVTQKDNKFLNLIKTLLGCSDKIKIELITAAKFVRQNPFVIIKLLFCTILAMIKSFLIFRKYRPDIVFSTGGYTSVPVVLAGKLFSPFTPVVLHEQNCKLSMTTRLLSFFATKVCLGFDMYKNKKFVFTGNPLRDRFFKSVNKEQIYTNLGFKKDKLTLLVFGGSQGAKSINTAILNFVKKNLSKIGNLQIIHITGMLDFDRVSKEYETYKDITLKVYPYVENMEELYSISDIVVSRAGAMTVSELMFFKLPAILIPLPTAAELHQHYNANFLKTYGCAVVIFQNKNWQEMLNYTLTQFITNPSLLDTMRNNYNKIPQSKENIESVIQKIYITNLCKKNIHRFLTKNC